MNIQFKEITIENFRSIEKATVELSQQGIVIVKGINNYEDKALSNGSGKSSIFEAIVFALFEETSNGDKDVANRIINNGYYIKLLFSIGGIDYTIIRKNDGKKSEVKLLQGTEELSARNKTDTNKQIIQLLGINKNLFLDSVFLSQEAKTNLASLQPTARKERLEILTNTDSVVNSFKERLKDKQIEYEAKCINWEKERNTINGKIQTLSDQVDQYKQKINEIEKQIAYRDSLGNIDEVEDAISKYIKDIDDLRKQTMEKTDQLTKKQQEIDDYKDNNKALLENQNQLMISLNSEKSKLTAIQNESEKRSYSINYEEENIKKVNKEIDKILKSDTCPTCGRKYDNVNEEHITNTINEYKESIKEFENHISELNSFKEALNKEAEKQVEVIKELDQKLQDLQKQIDDYNKNANVLMLEKSKLQEEYNVVDNQIVKGEKELNNLRNLKDKILKIQIGNKQEFQDLLDGNSKQLNELELQLKSISDNYDVDNNYVGTLKHCQQLVVKDFRSYLLKTSIEYLNNILKKYSIELFSNEKDVIFIKNDDTKLDIMLGDSSYESLSGGEKTRVNIALLLAQKSLASIIGNMSCNIIILDEVLGYCDSSAESNIINLITRELNSLESIYMVSHKEIQVASDSLLVIEKDSNGLSHIKEHW